MANDFFRSSFERMQREVHETAKEKGWWDEPRENGTLLMLMVTELAEAMESVRLPAPSDHIPDFHGVEEELADVVIRIMDFCEARGLRLADAIEAKALYNKGREHRHGGKRF